MGGAVPGSAPVSKFDLESPVPSSTSQDDGLTTNCKMNETFPSQVAFEHGVLA